MPNLPLVYYGKPGLEADVFQAYMASSGFPVLMVTNTEGRLPPSVSTGSSILVISLERAPEELLQLADEMQVGSNGSVKWVLILADGRNIESKAPAVEVFLRPYRLSEIADRIRAISRNA